MFLSRPRQNSQHCWRPWISSPSDRTFLTLYVGKNRHQLNDLNYSLNDHCGTAAMLMCSHRSEGGIHPPPALT